MLDHVLFGDAMLKVNLDVCLFSEFAHNCHYTPAIAQITGDTNNFNKFQLFFHSNLELLIL